MDGTAATATQATKGNSVEARGIIKLAILAVGGQGGGVLTDWIVDVAELNGYQVQATSVAGVAQRTGATVYYIEMMPAQDDASKGCQPVFALAPSAGDVDIVIAAELMEAGRAMQRGFITPERTTLIYSDHRALATVEKIVPGDGIGDAGVIHEAAKMAAQRVVTFDMEGVALDAGTVISASLFGALAGARVLPFARESFEEAIRTSGRGVDASLAAFREAERRALGEVESTDDESAGETSLLPAPTGPEDLLAAWTKIAAEIERLPMPTREMASLGLAKVVDFEDPDYGAVYLERLHHVAQIDRANGGEAQNFALTETAAKYIANAMAYDDLIRVADLKTRSRRGQRIAGETRVTAANVTRTTEYFHPGAREVCSILPAGLGAYIEGNPRWFGLLDRLVNRGRRVRSDGLRGFLTLYALGALRGRRRRLLRHRVEQAHLEAWLDRCLEQAPANYELAVALLRTRRLIKGYSDTHARGLSKFDKVMAAARQVQHRPDAAEWVDRLIRAALADEQGEALDGALATIGSFVDGEV